MGLFNSTVLDWAIGIVFVYLLLAILCTTINEWIAGITGVRAQTLKQAIAQLLDDQPHNGGDPTKSFLAQFYAHPLIAGMMTPGKKASDAHPSYLPSRTFATAVMDLATVGTQGSITFVTLESGIKNLPDGDVKTALLSLLQNASGDLNRAQKNIEHWFDDTMERASGWYKRRTQVVTVVVAAVLTIGTNADTVRIGHVLWTNNTLRSTIVEKAKKADTSASNARVEYEKNNPMKPVFKPAKDDLSMLSFVLGWQGEDLKDGKAWLLRILGWFLSTVAISMGAPFWFDMLNKVMNVRNAGKKPDTSDDTQTLGKTAPPQAQVPATVGGQQ
jgi:hypothetical protein